MMQDAIWLASTLMTTASTFWTVANEDSGAELIAADFYASWTEERFMSNPYLLEFHTISLPI